MTLPTPDHSKLYPPRPAPAPQPAACFTVLAEAGPGMLPRVLEPFAKRSLTPARLYAARDGGELAIDLQCAGLVPVMAAQIANELRKIWGVKSVLTAARRAPPRAA